jgi:hypothetical protein
MPCSTCPKIEKVKGSNLQSCSEYNWLFSPELAKKQKLCSNKANTTDPTTLPVYNEQGPKWIEP